jgi:hypothetical protein
MLANVLADYRIEYLKHFKASWLLHLPPGLTLKKLHILQTQRICIFCTYFRLTAIVVLYNIDWLL